MITRSLFFLFVVLMYNSVYSQTQGINYKAIIKDVNGNVIANNSITVQFIIFHGPGGIFTYQETHTTTTDDNGLIIANIGEGTPVSGTYNNVNWETTTALNTQIDTGSGWVDVGTTEFKTVPYALHAKTASNIIFSSVNGVIRPVNLTDNFVIGSNMLDFNGTYGTIDYTSRMFFNKTKGAFRAGTTGAWSQGQLLNRPFAWDDTNVGMASFASGADNEASGNASSAMGYWTTASGGTSTAMGSNTTASGSVSTSLGNSTQASGNHSTAMGNYTTASEENSTAMGKETTASGVNSTAMGQETTASGVNSTAMGVNSIASGFSSTTMGFNTRALGSNSTAMGRFTRASGTYSTTMGYDTEANGEGSTAMGDYTIANGAYSTSMGSETKAIGIYSTSMGKNTKASSYASLAIGRYNVGGGNATSWVVTDPLFEVGFGSGYDNKSNALTITKNGRVGIGTNTPTTFLQLTNGYEATFSNGSGYFMIGRETGPNLVFDTNEILARNNGGISNLHLQQEGGNVYVGGTLTHSSDRRLKKDITPLSYGLETILQLNPVAYNWINRTQVRKSLGLIAQEVQPIVGEIVHEDDDEAKTLSISYTELIPVLINAVKDLKAENDALRSRVEALEKN